ncbi:hypothetical protein FGF99_24550 [Salmonella sp. gx-f8]|nr:hypothetical protein [Salmonella sp. gx-f8]
MDAKLGRTLYGKEGIFWRSVDFDEMDGKSLPNPVNSDSVKNTSPKKEKKRERLRRKPTKGALRPNRF